MASGLFGTPISEETVRATGEYKEPITQKDVADYAMKMINAGGKDLDAQKFVDNLKDSTGVCDLMFGWGIPYIGDNGVHTEIREEGFFPLYNRWGYTEEMLQMGRYTSTDNRYGYVSKAEIGEGTTANARAVFQLA